MPASRNQIARKTLERVLGPALQAWGFDGRSPDFQRRDDQDLHLLAVVFDKHGGGFFVEFCRHPAGDLQTSWGEVVPESALTVAHTPFEQRARLQQTGQPNSLGEDWFRFDDLSDDGIVDLVEHVAGLLPQVDAWLSGGHSGPNISDTAAG